MPLPTKITKPAGNPTSNPFEFRVEVNYEPPSGAPNTTHATVQATWSSADFDYVASSVSPPGTVDSAAGTAVWSNVVITAGTASAFQVELSCIVAGSGSHSLNAQALDLDNGGRTSAPPKGLNCPG